MGSVYSCAADAKAGSIRRASTSNGMAAIAGSILCIGMALGSCESVVSICKFGSSRIRVLRRVVDPRFVKRLKCTKDKDNNKNKDPKRDSVARSRVGTVLGRVASDERGAIYSCTLREINFPCDRSLESDNGCCSYDSLTCCS